MSQSKNGGAVSGEKASPKLLVGYGLGEVACQMSWYMINNYLNIFYTDIVGLSGAAVASRLFRKISFDHSAAGIQLDCRSFRSTSISSR